MQSDLLSPTYVLAQIAHRRGMEVVISPKGKDINGRELPDYLQESVVIHTSEETARIFNQVRQTPEFKALEEMAFPAADFENRVKECCWAKHISSGVLASGLTNRVNYFESELARISDSELAKQYREEIATTKARIKKLGGDGPLPENLLRGLVTAKLKWVINKRK